MNLGSIYSREGESELAVTQWQTSLHLLPKSAHKKTLKLYELLGHECLLIDVEQATVWFEKLVRSGQTHQPQTLELAEWHLDLAKACAELGRLSGAGECLQRSGQAYEEAGLILHKLDQAKILSPEKLIRVKMLLNRT